MRVGDTLDLSHCSADHIFRLLRQGMILQLDYCLIFYEPGHLDPYRHTTPHNITDPLGTRPVSNHIIHWCRPRGPGMLSFTHKIATIYRLPNQIIYRRHLCR